MAIHQEGLGEPPALALRLGGRHRLIEQGARWALYLHKDQSYLGRSIVYFTARELDDPLQLSLEEQLELWTVAMPRLVAALTAAFQPDRVNYAHLANRKQHVHWHVVPRYERNPVRHFAGETFVDRRVGKGFAPSKRQGKARKKELSREVLEQISAELQRHLP